MELREWREWDAFFCFLSSMFCSVSAAALLHVCVCVCVFSFSCMLQGTMDYDGDIQRYIETTNNCSSCDGNNAIIKTASPSPTTKVSKDLGFQGDDGK
jgi:hypothetical protein